MGLRIPATAVVSALALLAVACGAGNDAAGGSAGEDAAAAAARAEEQAAEARAAEEQAAEAREQAAAAAAEAAAAEAELARAAAEGNEEAVAEAEEALAEAQAAAEEARSQAAAAESESEEARAAAEAAQEQAAAAAEAPEPEPPEDPEPAESAEPPEAPEPAESPQPADAPQPPAGPQPFDDSRDPVDAGAEPLTMSFIVTDVSVVAQALGWEVPDQGDLEVLIEAFVTRANDTGGVAGRPIRPVVRIFNAITDSPISEEQLCNAITQDDQADVVVLTGQFQENARPCYAAAGTLMLDVTLFPMDRSGYAEFAPYLWSPLLPSYDDLLGGLAAALESAGWFEGATVGVIGIDSDMNRRNYAEILEPRLAAAGVEVASLNWADPSDGTSLEAGMQQATLEFKSAGVDKVIAVGGSRLASWMLDIGATQNFSPAYAVTSYDSPEFNIRNYADLMVGSVGISVLPAWDVAEDQYPAPANDAEALCLDIAVAAGAEFETRANARSALLYCDAVRLLQLAGDHATSLDAEGIGSAMWAIGDRFEAATVYSVAFEEGSYTGGAGYRLFAYDEACECMVIRSDTIPFGG
jgi:hypothetical protein